MNAKTFVLIGLLWILFVLYPNPTMLFITLWHTLSPPIDPSAVKEIASALPDDPNVIRDEVLWKLVTYDYDWYIYDVPWYFPSTSEVVRDKRGDCESQAVMLASILRAKGIPYELKMSFDHIWVDYESKKPAEMEHDDMAFVERDGDTLNVRLPKHFDLDQFIRIQLDARWHPMPALRKLLLVAGLALVGIAPVLQHICRNRAQKIKSASLHY